MAEREHTKIRKQVSLLPEAAEKLGRLAGILGVTQNELIAEFIEDGLRRHKSDLEQPGDYGTSPTGINYRVREDGSRSFVGYGGAFD